MTEIPCRPEDPFELRKYLQDLIKTFGPGGAQREALGADTIYRQAKGELRRLEAEGY